MDKKIVSEQIKEIYLDGLSLSDAINMLVSLEDIVTLGKYDSLYLSGGMEPEMYSNDEYYHLYLMGTRLETDEEHNKRIDSVNEHEEYQRKLYEQLKAKYEGK